MCSYLVAARTVFLDFHLFRMLTLIPCADVVLFTAFCALESNIFSGHF